MLVIVPAAATAAACLPSAALGLADRLPPAAVAQPPLALLLAQAQRQPLPAVPRRMW